MSKTKTYPDDVDTYPDDDGYLSDVSIASSVPNKLKRSVKIKRWHKTDSIVDSDSDSDSDSDIDTDDASEHTIDLNDQQYRNMSGIRQTRQNMVIRKIVPRNERTTSNKLSTMELVRVISVRTAQITAGGPSCEPVTNIPQSPLTRALRELLARSCVIELRRHVGVDIDGNELIEVWDVNETIFPTDDLSTLELLVKKSNLV